jgi:hypothetical protein
MVGERRELVLFDISMNSLLDVKVFAHLLYNLNKTINQLINFCIYRIKMIQRFIKEFLQVIYLSLKGDSQLNDLAN